MKLIGISGKRESGKTSLASFLVNHGYHKVSLATPLKLMCMEQYGLTEEQCFGKDKETPTHYRRTDGHFFTPRDILIREGCLKRSINPDYWCRLLAMDLNPDYDYVIDDIRFLNEIHYFKRLGMQTVRLERDQNAIGKAALDDLSETELDTYDAWDFVLPSDLNLNLHSLESFAEDIWKLQK